MWVEVDEEAFLFRFTGVLVGVFTFAGEGEGESESDLRFWIEVDLDSREGGWANAGRDLRVERAKGDCDILPYFWRVLLICAG